MVNASALGGIGAICERIERQFERKKLVDWDEALGRLIITFPGAFHELTASSFFARLAMSLGSAGLDRSIDSMGSKCASFLVSLQSLGEKLTYF